MYCGRSRKGRAGLMRTISRSWVSAAVCVWAAAFLLPNLRAKETGIDGVMVYTVAGGPAFVQFRGLLINGKMEFRSCGGPSLDKNSYKNLPKIASGPLTSLERMPDGSLQAEFSGQPAKCVVPADFKFDKQGEMPMSDLIDKMAFTAQVVGSEPAGVTAFPAPPKGSKIFIVAPTDVELARYLRASRTGTIAQWQTYLGIYAAGPHAVAARQSLETLLLADGQTELQAYRSAKPGPGRYAHLKSSQQRVTELAALQATEPEAQQLKTGVQAELTKLCDAGQADLAVYRKALTEHTKGYAALVAAREPSDAAIDIDPKFPAAITLRAEVVKETNTLDNDLKTAQAAVAAQHFDDAYNAVKRYMSFVDEESRLKSIEQVVYKHHMDAGMQLEGSGKWAEAAAEYEKANAITPTEESKAALASAHAGLLTADNKAAADAALAKSQHYIADEDFIHAYEVLLSLTTDQRKLVADAMKTIEPSYIAAATDWAKKAQQTHSPIQGKGDEDAMRQAYTYLERVHSLSDDPDVEVRMGLLSDQISTYYVGLATKFMAKPVGSGVGVGWSYLDEAATYQPGLPAIRDLKTSNSAIYQLKSKLSVLVQFRDQTSRRDSVGFAEQMQDAIATGLETSKLPVRVLRPTNTGIEGNYTLVGEILQHRPLKTEKPETQKSNYRFSQHEIPNPAWNKADQAYADAQTEANKAQEDLRVAVAKNNKKMISDAQAKVDAAQKQMSAARTAENAISKTLQEDVIREYSYTKRHIEITDIVELSFRIIDSSGNTIEESTPVKKEVLKKFTVLEGIKPDDTDGVKDVDAPPDEQQLMIDVEIAARDELVKLAIQRVADLPAKILAQARAKVKSEDSDAAAEAYILYLNSTLPKETAERTEAIKFLVQNYNIRGAGNLSASTQ